MGGYAVRGQRAAPGFRVALFEQSLQRVVGDPCDIFTECDRILEDVVIDPLEDVADPQTGLVAVDTVGVVDVAGTVGVAMDEVRPQVEHLGDTVEIVHRVRIG